jgi:hypothetical protein
VSFRVSDFPYVEPVLQKFLPDFTDPCRSVGKFAVEACSVAVTAVQFAPMVAPPCTIKVVPSYVVLGDDEFSICGRVGGWVRSRELGGPSREAVLENIAQYWIGGKGTVYVVDNLCAAVGTPVASGWGGA